MKAKSLMTVALALSLLFVSANAFAHNVKLQDVTSISVLGPAGHGPRGVPFEHINLTAALNDRVHGHAWGTLLEHNKPGKDEKHGRQVLLRRDNAPASDGRVLVLVFLLLPGDSVTTVPSITADPSVAAPPTITTAPSVSDAPAVATSSTVGVTEVPEPAAIVLLGTSLTLLAVWRLLRKRQLLD